MYPLLSGCDTSRGNGGDDETSCIGESAGNGAGFVATEEGWEDDCADERLADVFGLRRLRT